MKRKLVTIIMLLGILFGSITLEAKKATDKNKNKKKGALIGAGIGAVVGQVFGKSTKGTAIGAAVGAAIGTGVGAQKDKQAASSNRKTTVKKKTTTRVATVPKKTIVAKKNVTNASKELDGLQTEYKDNLLYEIGQNTPFSGLVRSYYPNGNIETETSWRNGKPDGIFRTYYEEGEVKSESIWKAGEQFGETAYYLADGSVDTGAGGTETVAFAEIEKNEIPSEASPITSEKTTEIETKEVKTPSIETTFDKVEEKDEITYLIGEKEPFTGNVGEYSDKKIITTYSYKDGKLDGITKIYDADGNSLIEEEYEEGTLIGRTIIGDKTVEKDGLLYAKEQTEPYYGTVVVYNENNVLVSEKDYLDGELSGLSKTYDESGRLIAVSNYEKGKLEGISKDYDENGNEFASEYKDGEILTRSIDADQTEEINGVLYEKGKADVAFTGKVVFLRNGRKQSEKAYKSGKLDGTEVEFYNNGNPKVETIWKDGVAEKKTEYNNNGQLKVAAN
ncbi:MAG: glycine zipper 2TM domain-containing protein [Fusobacteriaceae bacterium]|jgi:antitoxin component YwqK of YwqJK toxin-antitoxin module|nr:glycine zipper 2TM domain-containing protein [Fusobacteriaceae bacterium]